MRLESKIKTPSFAGATELVVCAAITPGLLPSLDTVTYKSRVKQLLKLLHAARKSSHEFQMFRALSDAVERVGVIHSLRVAVLEPEDKIMLSVNFDGTFESYLRVIWQKAPRLLDLIFCNTVGYVTGWDHSFEEWGAWLRSVQVETPFFYTTPGVTYQDLQYLRMNERHGRRDGASEAAVTRITTPTAERIAWDIIQNQRDPQNGSYASPPATLVGGPAGVRQGLQGLAAIYRLADLYPPNTPDGLVLHRAARELLPEFARMQKMGQYSATIRKAGWRFQESVAWFKRDEDPPLPPVRTPPELPVTPPDYPADQVQGGILRPYDDVTHGCMCLLAFDSPAGAGQLLSRLRATTDADTDALAPGQLLFNIAFTAEGLRACGLTQAQLDRFPEEFRQGMEQRAAVLGDVRGNHPRRWKLPPRNWPQAATDPYWCDVGAPDVLRVPLEAVHAIVQIRLVDPKPDAVVPTSGNPRQSIAAALMELFAAPLAVQPLSLQWMERLRKGGQVVDHFGFTDGLSQPCFAPQAGTPSFPNQVQLGEALVGYDNAADHAADLPVQPGDECRALLFGGSYLVVRKLRQNVSALDQAVDVVVTADSKQDHPIGRERVLAKMMGRWPLGSAEAGRPLVPTPPAEPNDFNYLDDSQGQFCPVGAHIRRTNPRVIESGPSPKPSELQSVPGARPPRLLRRSLPYGVSSWSPTPTDAGAQAVASRADRGLVFMAYNASIGEQFEVVQRWISAGNSSGGYSGQSDPFLGVPESGRKRFYRFDHEGRTLRMHLDGSDMLGADPLPVVQLEWGAYAFAPSVDGLDWLRQCACAVAGPVAVPWSVAEGERELSRLRRIEAKQGSEAGARAWKAALEDAEAQSSYASASLWAAIRQRHGGVLRVPYGVLVADRALVDQVLVDELKRYSVSGYQQRLKATIGAIYLGLDDGPDGEYRRQSAACNQAIQALTQEEACHAARNAANATLDMLIKDAVDHAIEFGDARWELSLDVRELIDHVLARLCKAWFGVSEVGGFFKAGGFHWTWQAGQPVFYPGHFTAPSRHTFQPLPAELVAETAISHGRQLTQAMLDFLKAFGHDITAPVTAAVLRQSTPHTPASMDLAARTVVGAMMGFLPTTDGLLRRVVNEWMRDGTFWALRARTLPGALADSNQVQQALLTPLRQAMQLRPVPELIWRTARRAHRLGSSARQVRVQRGDVVIVALVSATQQGLQQAAAPDVMPIFGGDRQAHGAPTHACPGYAAAMGVMLGFLGAVLDRSDALRPGPGPGILVYEGDLPVQTAAVATEADAQLLLAQTHVLMTQAVRLDLNLAGATEALTNLEERPMSELLAWGDSWIYNEYPPLPLLPQPWDFCDALDALGYTTASFRDCSFGGNSLEQMAAELVTSPRSFYKKVSTRVARFKHDGALLPKAVLLCGGGNDVHVEDATGEAPLCRMLNRKAPGMPMLKPDELTAFVDVVLADRLRKVLEQLVKVTEGLIPIVVHGYDHPIPDGRHYLGVGPWLSPCIAEEKGYAPLTEGVEIMSALINRLNGMIRTVVAGLAPAARVHHLDLTGTLAAQPQYAQRYSIYWSNELHPTEAGFKALAKVVHDKLGTV